jgi:catechol 2,3-dioxygenase-like lactoylglutathione lyase family enzyme
MNRLINLGLGTLALVVVAGMAVGDAAVRITGYHNIHIGAVDPEAAVAWYVQHLGAVKTPTPATHVMLGDTLIAFQKADTLQPSVGSVIDHWGLSVPDLDATMQALEGSGATVLSPARDAPGLFKLAFIEDPFGVKIELVQDTEWPGFHHVHLRVQDPAATLDWYETMLGGAREQLKGRIEGLRYDGVWLLAAGNDGETLAPSGERAIRNIAWGIADMDEADAAFKAAGAPTLVEPFDVNEFVKVAFYQDPDGVSVELLQLP